MAQALGQAGLFTLIMFAGLAWGFARVLDAPRWAGQAILLAVVLIMLAGQLLLPPEAYFRQSVGGALRALVVVAIAAVPFLIYRRVLRRLRARHDAAHAPTPAPVTGRVALVPETAVLRRDLAGLIGTPPETGFGLIRRDAASGLSAGAVVTVREGLASAAPLWVAEGQAAQVAELLDAAAQEARERGALALELEAAREDIAAAALAAGFAETSAPAGPRRFARELR